MCVEIRIWVKWKKSIIIQFHCQYSQKWKKMIIMDKKNFASKNPFLTDYNRIDGNSDKKTQL